MEIISDSREQILIFKESNIMKLNVGDITTTKLLDKFHIERKSLEDLYGTLIQGHARFRKEILRAAEANIDMPVYVEGTRSDFIMKRFPQGWKRKMKPGVLSQIIDTMTKKYDLEFVWCDSRDDMKEQILTRLASEELMRIDNAIQL